jgi:hypothetical protein
MVRALETTRPGANANVGRLRCRRKEQSIRVRSNG